MVVRKVLDDLTPQVSEVNEWTFRVNTVNFSVWMVPRERDNFATRLDKLLEVEDEEQEEEEEDMQIFDLVIRFLWCRKQFLW